jgi:hypothetical protein
MKKGMKIKYCAGMRGNKEVIKTAFVLRDDGDYIWISETREELNGGYGCTISVDELR